MDTEWVAVMLTLAGFFGSLVNALWARRERMAAAQSAADAHQVQESMAESQASIAASLARPSVAFEVLGDGHRGWVFRNRGQNTATNVRPEWPHWVRLINGDDPLPAEMGPGVGISFSIAGPKFGERRNPSMRVTCDQLLDGVSVIVPTRWK